MKRKGWQLSCLVLMMAMLLVGCTNKKTSSNTIKIGVRDDIMNFSFYNESSDKYYGLEIDLANELAKRLGYANVEFVTVQPNTRKEMLLNGDVDCLIALYSIVETREENFDFSLAYYTDEAKIMVEKSSGIEELNDLKNKKIGILSGSNTGPELAIKLNEYGLIGDKVISNQKEGTQYDGLYVKKASSYEESNQFLEEGIIDAMCADGAIISTYMNENRIILDIPLKQQQYGVATQKGSALSEPIKEAINAMLEDGTITQLIDKWN